MLALKSRVRHAFRDAEIVGRCLPGRYDQEFKYDLRYADGTVRTNVPESELVRASTAQLALALAS